MALQQVTVSADGRQLHDHGRGGLVKISAGKQIEDAAAADGWTATWQGAARWQLLELHRGDREVLVSFTRAFAIAIATVQDKGGHGRQLTGPGRLAQVLEVIAEPVLLTRAELAALVDDGLVIARTARKPHRCVCASPTKPGIFKAIRPAQRQLPGRLPGGRQDRRRLRRVHRRGRHPGVGPSLLPAVRRGGLVKITMGQPAPGALLRGHRLRRSPRLRIPKRSSLVA